MVGITTPGSRIRASSTNQTPCRGRKCRSSDGREQGIVRPAGRGERREATGLGFRYCEPLEELPDLLLDDLRKEGRGVTVPGVQAAGALHPPPAIPLPYRRAIRDRCSAWAVPCVAALRPVSPICHRLCLLETVEALRFCASAPK